MKRFIYDEFLESTNDANDILEHRGINGLLEYFEFWLKHNEYIKKISQSDNVVDSELICPVLFEHRLENGEGNFFCPLHH